MKLLFHPRTHKFLRKLNKKEAIELFQKIEELSKDPFSNQLDIKKLTTTKRTYRMRIGQKRVVYEIMDNVIYIQDIDFRGNIY